MDEEKRGAYAGKLYAQIHIGLDASEQEQASRLSADQLKPTDLNTYTTGWVRGYQSVDNQEATHGREPEANE